MVDCKLAEVLNNNLVAMNRVEDIFLNSDHS